MRVLFRADGGDDLGLGNVYRCLSLAAALLDAGLTTADAITFVIGYREHALNPVRERGFAALYLAVPPGSTDEQTAQREIVARLRPRLVVTDVPARPDRDAAFFHSLRHDDGDSRLLHLSDENAGRCAADIVVQGDVYHGKGGRSHDDGPGARPRVLSGPAYSQLNPVFAQARLSQANGRAGVFVCFGGADPTGMTARMGELAAALPPGLPVTLVAGAGVAVPDPLPAGWTLRRALAPAQIAAVMQTAALGIIAAGVMSYEAACMGLPCLLVIQNRWQEPVARGFAAEGVHVSAGHIDHVTPAALAATCTRLLNDPADLQKRSAAGTMLVDGAGTARVAAAVSEELP